MFGIHLYMCADWWHCYIQRLGLDEQPLDKSKLVNVRERIAKFLVEQVITAGWKFHADETVWFRLCMVTMKFLNSSLSMNFCDIVAFLLVRCISTLWDDGAEFCYMMHVNCGFLWIQMLDLFSLNIVISWLVPGCSPWWLPNPGWFYDAGGKLATGSCRGGLRICNGR
jgi:hypothetical protein